MTISLRFAGIRPMQVTLLCSMLLAAVLFTSCASTDSGTPTKPPSNSINKILPLGASRVEGDRPGFESFRFELWKKLQENNWTFDYIGTQSDLASYPEVNQISFDVDHEGRGGWTSAQILDGISEWLDETGAPDIVLFSSPGGNDLLQGRPNAEAVSDINSIIDEIQAVNPNVTILIEQLAPGRSDFMTSNFTASFNQMQQDVLTIASEQSTSTSRIIVVDMFTGFNDNLLADDVHYNEAGAEFIADRYYTVLVDILE